VNTTSFHSLHHTQFRTNYSLFMPLYDYLYGTLDKSSDDLYERTVHGRGEEKPDVVHLTHLTTPASIFHLRLGFASLASAPLLASTSVMRMLRLLGSWAAYPLASRLGRTFRSEASRLHKLSIETWVVPRYTSQVRTYGVFHMHFFYPCPECFFWSAINNCFLSLGMHACTVRVRSICPRMMMPTTQ
jgi:aldehyde decarbonylase